MTQYAFAFDVTRCSGCMACVVACQDQNDPDANDVIAFRHVTTSEIGRVSVCPDRLLLSGLPALRRCALHHRLSDGCHP